MKGSVTLFILVFSLLLVSSLQSQNVVNLKSILSQPNSTSQLKTPILYKHSANDSDLFKKEKNPLKNQEFKASHLNTAREDEMIDAKRAQYKKRFESILKELNEFIEKNKSTEL